jgi:hypothetical protein
MSINHQLRAVQELEKRVSFSLECDPGYESYCNTTNVYCNGFGTLVTNNSVCKLACICDPNYACHGCNVENNSAETDNENSEEESDKIKGVEADGVKPEET